MASTSAYPVSGPAGSRSGIQRRLGLPRLAGHGRLVGAASVDSVGTGLVLAFIVVYFVRTTGLSLPAVGGALSLARLLAAPTAIAVGPLIDRWGARRTAALGNVVSAIAYTGFLAADHVWGVVAVGGLAQVGQAVYWTSSTGLVTLAADGPDRPRWVALLHTVRNGGMGVGGAIGAFAIGAAGTAGLRGVVIANAVSYAMAASLLGSWRPARERRVLRPVADTRHEGGYRVVLADRRYLLLVAINLSSVFSALILSLLLTIFIIDGLHGPAWAGGALLMANTIQVVLTQSAVTKRLERYRPIRVIAAATGLYAAAYLVFAGLDHAPGWLAVAGLTIGVAVYTFAETAAVPFQETLSVTLAPEYLRGRYLAVYQLSWTFGQVVAPGLFALLLSHGPRWPWLFLAGLSVAAVPALLLLERLIAEAGPVRLDAAAAA